MSTLAQHISLSSVYTMFLRNIFKLIKLNTRAKWQYNPAIYSHICGLTKEVQEELGDPVL